MVELERTRSHEGVIVRQLAVIDRGPGNVDARRPGHRRDVLHQQYRQALLGRLVDGSKRQPVAMVNVKRSLIQVRLGRLSVDSSRGESIRLAQLSIDYIAIVVDRMEVVIRADLLDLGERIEQRLVIPEAYVVDRGRISVESAMVSSVFADSSRCSISSSP